MYCNSGWGPGVLVRVSVWWLTNPLLAQPLVLPDLPLGATQGGGYTMSVGDIKRTKFRGANPHMNTYRTGFSGFGGAGSVYSARSHSRQSVMTGTGGSVASFTRRTAMPAGSPARTRQYARWEAAHRANPPPRPRVQANGSSRSPRGPGDSGAGPSAATNGPSGEDGDDTDPMEDPNFILRSARVSMKRPVSHSECRCLSRGELSVGLTAWW